MTILGIGDASDNDTYPTTDWKKAADMGCKFAIIRATTTGAWKYGKPTPRADTRFQANSEAADSLNMQRLSYCWFDPRPQISGIEQADFFLETLEGSPGLFAIADVEPTATILYNASSLLRLRAWCEVVSRTWPVAIYSYPAYIDQLAGMGDISWMREYAWIVAHWDVTAPRDPYPWYPGSHAIWQYTANMLGSRYGFNAAGPGKATPRICLAVMDEP